MQRYLISGNGKFCTSSQEPLAVADLNRLFAAAKHEPGEVAPGIPASQWWPALLLTILDTRAEMRAAIAAPLSAYDPGKRTLELTVNARHPPSTRNERPPHVPRAVVHTLTGRTAAALDALPPRESLFPWAGKDLNIVFRHFRRLAERAGVKADLELVRITGLKTPEVLDLVDLDCLCDLPPANRRARKCERPPNDGPRRGSLLWNLPGVQQAAAGVLTVGEYAEETYGPTRARSGYSRKVLRYAVRQLYRFSGREIPFDELTPSLIDDFTQWVVGTRGLSIATATDCAANLRAMIDRDRDRVALPEEPGSLGRFFEERYRPIRLAGKSERSSEGHREAIRTLGLFLGRPAQLEDLTDDTLERFLAWCIGEPLKLSPATANKKRASLLALWRYAWRKRLLNELPRDVDRLTVPKRVPDSWSPEEFGRILTAAAQLPGEVCGIPARLYWPALLSTLYDTGLRVGAATKLRADTFDAATGWILATFDTQKQRADQAFQLHGDTVRLVAATQPGTRALLFPTPAARGLQALCVGYRVVLKMAGFEPGPRQMFHKIRRTLATNLADVAGEEAARQALGHSSLATTRAYIDPRNLRRRVQAAHIIDRPVFTAD